MIFLTALLPCSCFTSNAFGNNYHNFLIKNLPYLVTKQPFSTKYFDVRASQGKFQAMRCTLYCHEFKYLGKSWII